MYQQNHICDLEIIKNIKQLFNKEHIIFYGASFCGKECIKLIKNTGIHIFGFSDSNNTKWGNTFYGYDILSLQELKKLCEQNKVILIITSMYVKEILEHLTSLKIFPQKIYTSFGLKYSILMNHKSICFNKEWQKNFSEIYQNYNNIERYDFSILHVKEMLNWNLHFFNKDNPILIYQPGKVGSTSLYESLYNIGITAAHIHTFTDPVYYCKTEYQYLADNLLRNLKKASKLKIISAVREPISRDISNFFQTLFMPYYFYQNELNNDLCEKCIHSIRTAFLEDRIGKWQDRVWGIPYENSNIGYQFNWFNRNIKRNFGIDIYQYPFNKDEGYVIIKENNIEIMIMQLEKMNSLSKKIADFLEIENFKLINSNEGLSKNYYYAYKQLINEIQIPDDIINFYFINHNEALHNFYNDRDILQFKNKWLKNGKENRC